MLDIISVNRVFDHTHFDFLTLRERYDEKELKDARIEKVNNFLLELGTGFAYMSWNLTSDAFGSAKIPDLLDTHCISIQGFEDLTVLKPRVILERLIAKKPTDFT